MNMHRHSRVIICAFKTHLAMVLTALLLAGSPASAQPVDILGDRFASVQFFTAVLGEMDLEAAAAIVSTTGLVHTPDGDFQGHAGVSQFANSFQTAFSDVTFTTHEPSIADDLVMVRWSMTGIHSGGY